MLFIKHTFTKIGAGAPKRCAARALLVTMAVLLVLPFATSVYATQFERVILAGGGGFDVGNDIGIDAEGNRYITGFFQRQAIFGEDPRPLSPASAASTSDDLTVLESEVVRLDAQGTEDAFVAKYNPAGDLVWARQIGGSLNDRGQGIAVTSDGAVYVTGSFQARVQFPPFGQQFALDSAGQSDSFIARYNRDGEIEWAQRIGGPGSDSGLDAAVDSNGNVVITGNFSQRATLSDAGSATAATLDSAGGLDIFAAAYNAAGQLIWAQRAGGPGNDSGRGAAFDQAGEAYITGAFNGSATFGSGDDSITLPGEGADDIFVARYTREGSLRWASAAGGGGLDRGLAIAVDQQHNSYVTGFFSNGATFGTIEMAGPAKQIFLAKLDPDGAFVQATHAGGPGDDEGHGIARDSNGTIYLTGAYDDTATFGSGSRAIELTPVRPFPSKYIFIAAYDNTFTPLYAEGAGGEDTFTQSGNAVDVDPTGFVQITGAIDFPSTFGIGGGELSGFRTRGRTDIFVATYAPADPNDAPAPEPTPVPEPAPEPDPNAEVFYFSFSNAGVVEGVAFEDEDVVAFQPSTGIWALLVDGSDLGLNPTDLNAFHWQDDGSLLMSFDTAIFLPELGMLVDDSDIVRFIPSTLGKHTSGRFELFLDGSDVGLSVTSEDIDAIAVGASGRLIASTFGSVRAPAVRGNVFAFGSDLIALDAASLGDTSSGTWSLFFQGLEIDLESSFDENISAAWIDPQDGTIFFSPQRTFERDDAVIGEGIDLFSCSFVEATSDELCALKLVFDGSNQPLFGGESIDAFAVGDKGVLGDIGLAPDATTIFVPLIAVTERAEAGGR